VHRPDAWPRHAREASWVDRHGRRLRTALDAEGVLLQHDTRLPSATAAVVGETGPVDDPSAGRAAFESIVAGWGAAGRLLPWPAT
jgi:hypothetical protein